jgi:hypothetical protein
LQGGPARPAGDQQQQHRREARNTGAVGRTPAAISPETGWKDVIGSSLAFDDAAQVNLEITAASTGWARIVIKHRSAPRVKQQEMRSIAAGLHSPAEAGHGMCRIVEANFPLILSFVRNTLRHFSSPKEAILHFERTNMFDRNVHKLSNSSWFAADESPA